MEVGKAPCRPVSVICKENNLLFLAPKNVGLSLDFSNSLFSFVPCSHSYPSSVSLDLYVNIFIAGGGGRNQPFTALREKKKKNVAFLHRGNLPMKCSWKWWWELEAVLPGKITGMVERKHIKSHFSPERHMKAIIVTADFPPGPLRGWGQGTRILNVPHG